MTSRPGSDRPTPEQDGEPAGAAPAAGPVDRIVERFGGIRPMAHKLDVPVTTVQGWKKRGAIPLARHADLRASAVRHAIVLDEADLEAATPTEERPATEAPAGEIPTVAVIESVAEPVAEPAAGEPKPAEAADKPSEASKPADTARPDPVADPVASPVAEPAVETPRSGTIRDLPPPYVEPSGSGGLATGLSVVALLVGLAALTQPWWGPALFGGQAEGTRTVVAQSDPQLRSQFQQLVDRVAKLEQAPSTAGASGGSATALDAAVRQLAARIDVLEKRPSGSGAAAPAQADPRVDELSGRLGGLEQKLAAVGGNSQAAQDLRRDLDALKQQVGGVAQAVESRRDATVAAQALVLAAGQLRAALAAGQPFQPELQAVRSLGIADPEVTKPLDALAPSAAKGIPTQPQLADRFKPLAAEIVRAADRGDGSGWIDQVKGKLATLVTVRRQGGGVVGDSADAVVARAEAALAENNLAKAVEELTVLKGVAADTAAPWLADARARLAANQAGQKLSDRAIALLTTASGGKGAGQ